MADYGTREQLWDYSDNGNYDDRSDLIDRRERARRAARAGAVYDREGEYDDRIRQAARYRQGYERRPTGGYGRTPRRDDVWGRRDADLDYRDRSEDYDDRGMASSRWWPSELGYPPAPGYAPDRGGYPRSGERGSQRSGGRDERGFFERAGDEVMSWFGDREASERREIDHRGRGPKNYVRSDERIRDDVNDRLADDRWVDASDINVEVGKGEVTLSGEVSDRYAKRRAEDCAEAVSGVRHVQNNLRYRALSARGGAPEDASA